MSSSIQAAMGGRTHEMKRAILDIFTLPRNQAFDRIAGFDKRDWDKNLRWLDVSGMALYFLDRARTLGIESALPLEVEADLEQRLERNRVRNHTMMTEACMVAGWFHQAGIPYALLKGATLAPHSVSDPALRSQADIDILVHEKSLKLSTHYISRLGYRVHARSGTTLEFRAGTATFPDMRKMYSVHSERALELHFAPSSDQAEQQLCRRELRQLQGALVYSLSAPDILVQQALHLLKHLCGEHTRVSWVLEFRRHAQSRRYDDDFWQEVQCIAAQERNGNLAMAMAFWLSDALFDSTGINLPTRWSAAQLPDRVRLWLRLYAEDVLLSDTVGSKLYALLRSEIPGTSQGQRSTRQILLPTCVPIRTPQPSLQSRWADRIRTYALDASYILHRLRFHFIEGARFALQAARWKRAAARCGR